MPAVDQVECGRPPTARPLLADLGQLQTEAKQSTGQAPTPASASVSIHEPYEQQISDSFLVIITMIIITGRFKIDLEIDVYYLVVSSVG